MFEMLVKVFTGSTDGTFFLAGSPLGNILHNVYLIINLNISLHILLTHLVDDICTNTSGIVKFFIPPSDNNIQTIL
jgi:hypothetical protein